MLRHGGSRSRGSRRCERGLRAANSANGCFLACAYNSVTTWAVQLQARKPASCRPSHRLPFSPNERLINLLCAGAGRVGAAGAVGGPAQPAGTGGRCWGACARNTGRLRCDNKTQQPGKCSVGTCFQQVCLAHEPVLISVARPTACWPPPCKAAAPFQCAPPQMCGRRTGGSATISSYLPAALRRGAWRACSPAPMQLALPCPPSWLPKHRRRPQGLWCLQPHRLHRDQRQQQQQQLRRWHQGCLLLQPPSMPLLQRPPQQWSQRRLQLRLLCLPQRPQFQPCHPSHRPPCQRQQQ